MTCSHAQTSMIEAGQSSKRNNFVFRVRNQCSIQMTIHRNLSSPEALGNRKVYDEKRGHSEGYTGRTGQYRDESFNHEMPGLFDPGEVSCRAYDDKIGQREDYRSGSIERYYEPVSPADFSRSEIYPLPEAPTIQTLRTDDEIKREIDDKLFNDPFIDASGIEVIVRHAEVILTGTVEDGNMKLRVEDIGASVNGVKHTESHLVALHA